MKKKEKRIAVIGGGAAGFFAAIACAENTENAIIDILEKSNKLLSKVKVSGGGRCNLTHACFDNQALLKSYPRGERELAGAFSRFTTSDTVNWFEQRGVKLKTEPDGRIFPVTDQSQTIVDCLFREVQRLGITIKTNYNIHTIRPLVEGFELAGEEGHVVFYDIVLVAIGGHPKLEQYRLLAETKHTIVPPVPSLFTFNIPDKKLHVLAGVSVLAALVKIAGTKFFYTGPLLITHWGLSGPAVLKLSAYGARALAEKGYQYTVLVNWLPEANAEQVLQQLKELKTTRAKKQVSTQSPFDIPGRLWHYLLLKSTIGEETRWADTTHLQLNKLAENLCNSLFQATGKTTFKEEFVTCGGISLKEVDLKTMQSRLHKGLFFAGEVLDIDGITGGFNFQNAWTTGFLAGKAMGEE